MYKDLILHKGGYSIFKVKDTIYLYIYNNNYKCLLKTNKEVKVLNQFTIKIKSINKTLESFLKQFYLTDSTKIKFTGKGYKIKKNSNNNIQLLFNKAHITNFWYKNVTLKKLKKYKIIVKHNNNMKFIRDLISIRPINIFTKKGLRVARQVVYKKKGKK